MRIGCPVCRKPGPECDCPASIRLVKPLAPIRREPEATIRRHARASIRRLIERLTFESDRLIDIAVDRAEEGAKLYGETAWERSPDQLDVETDEELADAIVYQSIRCDVLDVTITVDGKQAAAQVIAW